ncbi:phage host specificity protein [Litorimonas cladophorae]|uniref:Phage host specificity protein n=1 Tax=Litorimonas cladophorae TaxID=1220491 RepID=A0A918KAN7_9PROT|nr:glycoside hydrolase/phage tail family protein [Litorimonas cladophorae]GGX56178.1 phage host specificity protein [Litorimonas cladophorae]
MANFAASATQLTGQALVRTASALAINTATSYISRAFDTRNFQGPRLDSLHIQTSRDGAPMARVFGRARLAGQIIWASHVREASTETPVGGKGGGPTQTDYSYAISFAVGLCEGEIAGIDRIWANGAPLETAGLDMRVYRGTEDQSPDPIISATEPGDVPAFRGTAYVVFEDFPLAAFGNRLPQLNFEVIRTGKRTGRLENLIQSVNLLPGSGEFAYATDIVEEGIRPGETQPLNMNNLSGKADIELALDQLQAQLPSCTNVSIISSWFATSTDIATCEIRPGVERRSRNIRHHTWRVGRATRATAHLVSADDEGRPNFGGTPSDESLIQAIRAIKARGMSVTLYPFILVDTAGFPWRGRITGNASDVSAFFGTADVTDYSNGAGEDHHHSDDAGFRNFILSHANLARRAGGVERFVIGSEMIGLTTIRDAQNGFPAVTELARLAGDVKVVLGDETGLTYAADWSEYFGFHPLDGSGDVYFHLDELWAHPAISAIGIDAYFPLSDWREGDHLDGQISSSIYDEDYLKSNVEGGEGYDWYYASDADRDAQVRTPISDWTYRYKDLRNWWSNVHRNKIAGAVQDPTSWVPQSKPFWLMEVGCPAVRYGANQPNVFSDGKSHESKFPYFSEGSRDDLIQRNYLEALIGYWGEPENNPTSTVTGQPMIDQSATSVWAWDARPFPDFPARRTIWSDGLNWQTGHWINGRMGGVLLQDVLDEICTEVGVKHVSFSGVSGLVSGFVIDRPMRARDALTPLIDTYDVSMAVAGGRLFFFQPQLDAPRAISRDELVAQDGGPIRFAVEDDMSSLRDVRLTYIDASLEYQTATLSTRNEAAETVRVADIQVPIVMDAGQARQVIDRQLAKSEPSRRRASFALPTDIGDDLRPGEIVTLPDADGYWQIERLRRGANTDVDLIGYPDGRGPLNVANGDPAVQLQPAWVSEPVAMAFNLPGVEGLQVGALMHPFRPADLSFADKTVRLQSAVKLGVLLSDLPRGPITIWDRSTHFDIWMPNAAFFSIEEHKVMSGQNRFAVETPLGWEVIGAASVSLIGPDIYRLHTLLRGVENSDDYMVDQILSGARVISLDGGLATLDIEEDFIGGPIQIEVSASGRSGASSELIYSAEHLRPLSVAHVSAVAEGENTRLNWTPRRLDNATKIDPSQMFDICWSEGEMRVSANTALIPVNYRSNNWVSITPVHSLTKAGRSVKILV